MSTPVSATNFRSALSVWPSGVTLVSTGDVTRFITVSAFSSVSLEPPLVLVSINNESLVLGTVVQSAVFAVNILAQGQQLISNAGASRSRVSLESVPHVAGNNGCAIVVGAAATLECDVWSVHPAGDHTVVIGLVTHTTVAEQAPLLYHRGRYGSFSPDQ